MNTSYVKPGAPHQPVQSEAVKQQLRSSGVGATFSPEYICFDGNINVMRTRRNVHTECMFTDFISFVLHQNKQSHNASNKISLTFNQNPDLSQTFTFQLSLPKADHGLDYFLALSSVELVITLLVSY